jgi:hypothetical protein
VSNKAFACLQCSEVSLGKHYFLKRSPISVLNEVSHGFLHCGSRTPKGAQVLKNNLKYSCTHTAVYISGRFDTDAFKKTIMSKINISMICLRLCRNTLWLVMGLKRALCYFGA